MKKTWIIFSLAAMVMLACPARAQMETPEAKDTSTKVDVAIQSANAWLALMDAQNYAQSWEESAAVIKESVPQDQWVKQLNETLAPLGNMVKRQIIRNQYLTELPNAPEGEYVVIQYSAEYEGGQILIETVTPMKESDGQWRVSGYFVQ